MKELSIEQKAKRYDEALERAKNTIEVNQAIPDIIECVESLFPELAENKDEKIRKALIKYLDALDDDEIRYGVSFKDMRTWVEKQKESNTNTHLPSFDEAQGTPIIKQGEQKPAIFIPKFRVGDKLVSTKNPRLTYEVLEVGYINELGNPEYKVEIFTDGKVSNPRNIHNMECYKVDEWAKLIEQKSWSEEDDEMLDSIIEEVRYMGDFPDYPTKEENELYDECLAKVDWLKSLKERYIWKPSDEQMKALNVAANYIVPTELCAKRKVLRELLEQLKKLRGE